MNFSRVKVSNYLNVIQIWNRFLTQTIGSLSIALNSHLITHLEFNHSFYRLGTWKVHLKVPSSLLITFIEPHKIHLQKKPQAFKYQTSNNKRWRYFQYFDRIFFAISLNKCKSKVQFVTYVLLYDKKKNYEHTNVRCLEAVAQADKEQSGSSWMLCVLHILTL